ncbi:phage tail tape measure protein [Micromonospora sp. CA-248260]|uniref:phage tail tape measure protein n=1 Tax=Micromonospora sp. CA-248260 TaxID=3239962 RepID=UPI003D8B4ECF
MVFNILAKDKASKTFDSIKGKAAVAGAAIGAVLAAGLATGLAATMDKSKSDALLAAQIGGDAQTAAEFGKISGNLYAKGFGDSVETASAAIKGVWQNALVPDDASDAAIEAVSAKVLTLGTVMVEESDRVSATVSTMLRTGMAKSAEEAFDILARGTQQGVNKAGDLLDTFEEYPTLFRSLGLNGTQAMGLLNQAIKGGARNADQAADALKELGIRAIDGSKGARAAYKLLGLDADSMIKKIAKGGPSAAKGMDQIFDGLRKIKDPVKQNAAGVGLLGTKWEDMRDAVLKMDLSTASKSLGDVSGAAQRAGDTLQNSTGAKVDQFKRKVQMGLVDVLGKAVIWIEKHNSVVKTMAMVLGPIVAIIGTVVAITKVWTVVQTALNVAMSLNPVGAIILGVMLLIGVIVLIATKTTWFQSIWQAVWGFLKGVGAWFAGPFAGFFVSAWQAISAGAMWLWNGVLRPVFNGISAAIGFVVQIVTSFAALWWFLFRNTIGAAALWLWNNAVKPAFNGIAAAANWLWQNALVPVGHGISTVMHGIGGVASWLWKNAIGPAVNGIRSNFDKVMGVVKKVGSVFKSIFGAIGGYVSGAFSSAVGTVKGSINSIIRLINNAVGFINGSVISKANKIPGVNFPHLPSIPFLAKGGTITNSGMAVVGENGPELLNLNRGAQVTPLSRSSGGNGGGGTVVLEFSSGGDPLDDLLIQLIRKYVRVKGRGDVQIAFGS